MKNYRVRKYCQFGKDMATTIAIVAGTVLLAAAMLMVVGVPPSMAAGDDAVTILAVTPTTNMN